VRHVVNVKDSFTRMNIEREKESAERKRSYREATDKLQKQQAERQQIRSDLYALFGMTDAHKRGKALEGVLNRLFGSCGILVREAFTVKGDSGEGIIEQIDGVVEIAGLVYVVEMKWWDKPIGREQIAPHIVSVFSGDVRGIFISYSGFTASAITDVKTALAHKVFDRDIDLGELLVKKIHRAQTHKDPLHRPEE
jgi:restriction endonuclease Mrr